MDKPIKSNLPMKIFGELKTVFARIGAWCVKSGESKEKQGPTRHRPMAHPVVFRYVALSDPGSMHF